MKDHVGTLSALSLVQVVSSSKTALLASSEQHLCVVVGAQLP